MERSWVAVVARAQLGDREAVAELVRGWHGPVWGSVRQMLGRDDVADDVSQEVWLGVVRGLSRLKEPDRFAAWLFTIARRGVVNQLRDKYADQPQLTQYDEPDPADHVVDRIDVPAACGRRASVGTGRARVVPPGGPEPGGVRRGAGRTGGDREITPAPGTRSPPGSPSVSQYCLRPDWRLSVTVRSASRSSS
nr:sigma-70 family RNA polymerase sigma factor [Kribbella rubisoli]